MTLTKKMTGEEMTAMKDSVVVVREMYRDRESCEASRWLMREERDIGDDALKVGNSNVGTAVGIVDDGSLLTGLSTWGRAAVD